MVELCGLCEGLFSFPLLVCFLQEGPRSRGIESVFDAVNVINLFVFVRDIEGENSLNIEGTTKGDRGEGGRKPTSSVRRHSTWYRGRAIPVLPTLTRWVAVSIRFCLIHQVGSTLWGGVGLSSQFSHPVPFYPATPSENPPAWAQARGDSERNLHRRAGLRSQICSPCRRSLDELDESPRRGDNPREETKRMLYADARVAVPARL